MESVLPGWLTSTTAGAIFPLTVATRLALVGVLVLLAAWLLLFLGGVEILGVSHYQVPEYEVVDRSPPFEVRRYGSYWVARLRMRGSYDDVADDSFQALFRYITGANADRRRMAMTVPVGYEHDRAGGALTFIMPRSPGLDGLPAPEDSRIVLEELPRRLVAAIRFCGIAHRSVFDEQARRLLGALQGTGYEPVGPPVLAQYNAPFVPGATRRNEVMIEVRPATPATSHDLERDRRSVSQGYSRGDW